MANITFKDNANVIDLGNGKCHLLIRDFPIDFPIESNGTHVVANVPRLWEHDGIARNIPAYGLKQWGADGCAGALGKCGFSKDDKPSMSDEQFAMVAAKARELMQARLDQGYAGQWIVRRTRGEADPLEAFIRKVLRSWLKLPAYAEIFADQIKAYDSIGSKDQKARNQFLDDWFAELPEGAAERAVTLAKEAKASRDREGAEAEAIAEAVAKAKANKS